MEETNDTTGTWYFMPEKPSPADLLANPPLELACGTGAFLAHATDAVRRAGE